MASTYTSRIRLEKQADGENPNAWGLILNQNVIDMVDEAVAGMVSVNCATGTTITLSTANGATDDSRNAAITLTGALGGDTTIVFPAQEKTYFIRNSTSGDYNVLLKAGTGTAVTATGQGLSMMVATDGNTVYNMKSEDNDTKIYSAFLTPAALSSATTAITPTEAKSIYQRINTASNDVTVEVNVGSLSLGQYIIIDKVTTTNKMTISWASGSQGLSLSSATDLAIGIYNGDKFSFTETVKA
jgi:hypothetical protein|tara:strand:- start:159 stop:887 length:729 start_codon:yes stop_codon:yes gene_type:complete